MQMILSSSFYSQRAPERSCLLALKTASFALPHLIERNGVETVEAASIFALIE